MREFEPAVELILDDKGQCAGAVLYSLDTEQFLTVKAKAMVITTGGFGRLHIRGFATTNHYGATGDGLVMAYRAGAKLKFMDSVQYHPTGAVFPEQIAGFLITEKIRGAGGQPLNKYGELFVFPREPRDIESAAIIRECSADRNMGVDTYRRPHRRLARLADDRHDPRRTATRATSSPACAASSTASASTSSSSRC